MLRYEFSQNTFSGLDARADQEHDVDISKNHSFGFMGCKWFRLIIYFTNESFSPVTLICRIQPHSHPASTGLRLEQVTIA